MNKIRRKILEIKEELCDGCGVCVNSCMEGALKIVDGKAKLVSESLCDGLGACIDQCPKGALIIVEKEAEPFKELESHDSSSFTVFEAKPLSNWPIKLKLVAEHASFLKKAKILLSSDCCAFALPQFHSLVRDRKVLIGCPKLDSKDFYIEKLTRIIKSAEPEEIILLIMEIPCCRGFLFILKEAEKASGRTIPTTVLTASVNGKILKEERPFTKDDRTFPLCLEKA